MEEEKDSGKENTYEIRWATLTRLQIYVFLVAWLAGGLFVVVKSAVSKSLLLYCVYSGYADQDLTSENKRNFWIFQEELYHGISYLALATIFIFHMGLEIVLSPVEFATCLLILKILVLWVLKPLFQGLKPNLVRGGDWIKSSFVNSVYCCNYLETGVLTDSLH